MYVHGLMIAAGETRHIDEQFLPSYLRPAPAARAPEPAPADPLAELRAQPVKKIAGQLDGLSSEQIEALRAAEASAETPRQTLLAAIDEELLERATAPDKGAGG